MWGGQWNTVWRYYKDYLVELQKLNLSWCWRLSESCSILVPNENTQHYWEWGTKFSPGVAGHSRQNRRSISSLIVQKLCILYFRHQRSCLEISKLLDSACCWKAHTYPCISLQYYLVMGENDPSLEIYSAVKSTPLSGFHTVSWEDKDPPINPIWC